MAIDFQGWQLNQGFWFLCGPESDAMWGLADEAIAWDVRARCISSFRALFGDLFQQRCTAHLSHMVRAVPPPTLGVSPLNSGLLDVVGLLLLVCQRPSESGCRLSRGGKTRLAGRLAWRRKETNSDPKSLIN